MASGHPAPADRRESSSADADPVGVVLAREPSVRLGALTIEPPMRRVLHDDGQEEFLEPRVMKALVALVRADGQILTRDELLAKCWPGVVVGEDSINRVMARLRRLAEGPAAGVFRVETIIKVGYRLVVESSAAPAAIPAAAASGESRLAVLAFDNLSGDADMAYFSDGVSEEIQQTVARAADLKVIGRTSSFHYRGADKDLKRVSAELKATHVLDGAVRRSGGRVRISAQLIECAGETTLWSDRFDRDLTDVFALQDEIAAAVAAALKVVLAPGPSAEPLEPAVYELLLKARNLQAGGGFADPTGAAFVKAVGLLEQASRLAPRSARVWGALAHARLALLRKHASDKPYAVARAEIVAAAERALELDPSQVTVHAMLVDLEPIGQRAEREAARIKAVAAAPNDATAVANLAVFYANVGRMRDALVLAKRAFDLDPLHLGIANQYAISLVVAGHYWEAQAIYDRLVADWPDSPDMLANSLAFTACASDSERRERLIQLAKQRGIYEGYVRVVAGWARHMPDKDPIYRSGFPQYARDELAQNGSVSEHLLAELCDFDLNDEAFALADQSSFDFVTDPEKPHWNSNTAYQVASQVMHPTFIRDPRYPQLVARLGLCDYWVQSGKWPDFVDDGVLPYDFKAACRALAGADG